MHICICHKINDKIIIECCKNGTNSLEDICDLTRAGTSCGGCIKSIEQVIQMYKNTTKITHFSGVYEFLSNKCCSTFFHKSIKYKTVTHAYQSLKMVHKKDAEKVRLCPTPELAIKTARGLEKRKDWGDISEATMRELLFLKFSSNVFLLPKLLETGEQPLGDDINFVGRLLMDIREELSQTYNNDE